MKQLHHTKEDCFLCGCLGRIQIKLQRNIIGVSVIPFWKECPLCNGKGHLNIINIKEANNV